jgi:hypothetical protein
MSFKLNILFTVDNVLITLFIKSKMDNMISILFSTYIYFPKLGFSPITQHMYVTIRIFSS